VERRPHRGKEFVDVVPLSWENCQRSALDSLMCSTVGVTASG
jgi:hypothetical protein